MIPHANPDVSVRSDAAAGHAVRSISVAFALGVALAMATPIQAQDFQTPPQPTPATAQATDAPAPATDEEVGFAADQLEYDDSSEIVTATGNVQMQRQGNHLRADKIVWNRVTGRVDAIGNVSIVDPKGNIAYGDTLEVTDTLKDGVVGNLLLVLKDGGRLVAQRGKLIDNIYTLDHAAFTPCSVEDSHGCPRKPNWQIKAVRVVYSPDRQRVTYHNAQLDLFGLPILTLPYFSHPVGTGGGSGFLVPEFRINGLDGFQISTPYYVRLSPSRDLTISPRFSTASAPLLEGTYRSFLGRGAYRVSAIGTYGTRIDTQTNQSIRGLRGYVEATGRFQLTPEWSIFSSLRRTTDRTFLRRFGISGEDRLRSTIQAERINSNSYFSLAGWSVQTLRTADNGRQMPLALPVMDYRLRLTDPILGGGVMLQANTLAISRSLGQDTQRAFVSGEWNLRRLTPMGQELTLTGYVRGDAYHSSDNLLTSTALYRGKSGWQGRGIAAVAADMRWPFIGQFLGGTQRIAPRVQIVASPRIRNLAVPNEDARSIDLEDSNLFALNRFPGYDRFEDSTRITYGVEYNLALSRFSLNSVVGQSYRLNNRSTLLPVGTGLSDRMSDIVGRTTIRWRSFLTLTHRFRVDKSSLAVRRNEIDATVGNARTYALISYLKLNRNITGSGEDLADREELRVGGRVAFARFWSVFGSTVIDLTDKKEDPTSLSDGFEQVRHRLGILYQDECLSMGLTWRRDYLGIGDARANNAFSLTLAFRNLGI